MTNTTPERLAACQAMAGTDLIILGEYVAHRSWGVATREEGHRALEAIDRLADLFGMTGRDLWVAVGLP